MDLGQIKDAILMFLGAALAGWVGFEVRTLRITVEQILVKVDGHEVRIKKLERDF